MSSVQICVSVRGGRGVCRRPGSGARPAQRPCVAEQAGREGRQREHCPVVRRRRFAPRRQAQPAATPAAPAKEARVGDFIIAEPVLHDNLTVFPVLSVSPKNDDRFITLEEGLKSGKVLVYEVGANPAAVQDQAPTANQAPQANQAPRPNSPARPAQQADNDSADVNHLMVLNRGEKPLYLMPGELIYGGQQDRCVGQESIIVADGKPVKIEVFCVEHGRWSYRGQSEAQAEIGQLAAGQNLDEGAKKKLAEATQKGQFVLKSGNLGNAGRVAIQEGKGQGEVWNQVGIANSSSNVQAMTGNFNANYTSADVTRQIDGYVKDIEQPVARRSQVVGAVAAVGGKVVSVDVFGSTPLFQKVWPKLLKGLAFDAAIAAQAAPSKKAQPAAQASAAKLVTLADAEKFFRQAMLADVKRNSEGQGGLVVTKRESAEVVSYSASMSTDAKAAPAAKVGGMGGAGFGEVHSSGYAK